MLINSGYATLRELQTVYDEDDALDMLECLARKNYQSWKPANGIS